jgi:cephalosporin-C deacetylase-like acetyl esterase
VKRGFVVIAFDPPGQGERLQYVDPGSGKSTVGVGTREHTMAGTQCLLTGTTLARYEIWDGIRAFDYLLTRKDVDPKRIAVAGNSGGGTQSAYLAVMEPRLSSAEVSCYMTSWATLWSGPGPQDAEQIFPGMLRDGLDFPDLLLAMAPRPVEMSVAIRDFFPIAGARATYAALRRLYSVADAEVKASYFEYDDEHGWSKPRREAMYRFFAKWLQGREDNSPEPPITPEPESELNATATGQVATSLRGETVQSLNQELAEKMFPSRTAARMRNPEELRRVIASRLGMALPVSAAQFAIKREIVREEYKGEQLTLTTEPGIEVPAVLFRPAGARRETYPATLLLDGRGKAEAWPQIEDLLRKGHLVLALDPRGIGEAGVAATGKGYTPEYQLAMRAVLVGKNMVGMQATDILAAIAYLKSRSDVSSVSLRASGRVGIAALCAAAFQPAVAESVIQLPIVSYMEFARARVHDSFISVAVPGVLRDFDLPDVAALIAPRRLTISADSDRRLIEREYAPAYSAYRRAGASAAFKTASEPH